MAIEKGHAVYYVPDYYVKRPNFLKYVLSYWLKICKVEDFSLKEIKIKVDRHKMGTELIENYHYLGKPGNHGITITGFINDSPIVTAIFSPPTRQEIAKKQDLPFSQVLELSRMAADPKFQIKNLISFFLSKAIKLVKSIKPDVKVLVAFADVTHNHEGCCYKASNWILDGKTNPNYWYQKDRNLIHKKKVWDEAKNVGMSEKDYANLNGYIKVVGKPKNRYIYII